MTACVICGQGYSKKVTDAHIKSHRVSKRKYAKLAAKLPQQAWDFYWLDINDYLRNLFPDPVNGGPSNPNNNLCKHGITSFKKFVLQYANKYGLQESAAEIQASL